SRYYDPTLGRFTQRDKFNEAGFITGNPAVIYNPLQLNDYTYVGNNPLIYTDPWGYWTFSIGYQVDLIFIAGGSLSIMVSIDDSYNYAIHSTVGIGGGFSVSANPFLQITNAKSVYELSSYTEKDITLDFSIGGFGLVFGPGNQYVGGYIPLSIFRPLKKTGIGTSYFASKFEWSKELYSGKLKDKSFNFFIKENCK
ncbi:MAG: RHS repeat-associated core domain-containing protein, partial [Candidatus Muiribacteriota bacterium]